MTRTTTPEPTCVVGCDVGKAEIVAYDSRSGQTTRLPNAPAALASFAAALDPGAPIVCEATGGYEAALLDALLQAGRAVHRADARKVKAFIRSFGILGKTDRIDARALARYGQERHAQLAPWRPREATRQRLRTLVLTRRDLLAARTAWKNRLAAPNGEPAADYIRPLLACLEAQIAALDTELKTLVQEHPPLARALQALTAIPGLGTTAALGLLALMPELGTLNRRTAAALAGLAPHPKQSGASDAYRRTRGGRPEVKRLLFMAALAAARHNPDLKSSYQRLRANGKKPLLAIAALMRKLITIANAVLKTQNLQLS